MKQTDNYKLTLYEKTDNMSITAEKNSLNANMKIIDEALNSKADGTDIPAKVSDLANDSGYQTENDVNAKIEEVIGSAPEALNTLKELSDALGGDEDFANTMTNELAKKANSADIISITNAEIDTICS